MNFNHRTQNLVPYVVSARTELTSDPNWLILDWNESTQPISDYLKRKLTEFINDGRLNLYGDVEAYQLRESLSVYADVPADYITVFNGSDSALNIILECILLDDDICVLSEPEYSQIKTFIFSKGAAIRQVFHENVFNPDLGKIQESLQDAKLLYISNPNNPTGNFIPVAEIERMIELNPKVWFLIDEAYIEFQEDAENHLKLVDKYPNVIILRTFSKAFGLAGLRIGYIISNPSNIQQINKVRNGKEVSSIAQFAAKHALADIAVTKKFISDVQIAKKWFLEVINKLDQIQAYPSAANFVIVKSEDILGLNKHLYKSKILIRDRSALPGLQNCMRITIGTIDQVKYVYQCIKDYFDTK